MTLGIGFGLGFGSGLGIPSCLIDGNTKTRYNLSSPMTLSGLDVARWNDIYGSGRDVIGNNVLKRPTLGVDGITFDRTSGDFMVSATFPLAQPIMIYAVLRMDSWVDWAYMWDGYNINSGACVQENVTPKICAYAGSQSGFAIGLTVGAFGIVRLLLNGASSKLIANAGTPITGNFGAGDMAGISLGAKSDGNTPAGVTYKDFITRAVNESASDETAIYNYLKALYSL
jgi:hypothetical protein